MKKARIYTGFFGLPNKLGELKAVCITPIRGGKITRIVRLLLVTVGLILQCNNSTSELAFCIQSAVRVPNSA